MHRNNNRRQWNNEKSHSVEQEVHEYNQGALADARKKDDKRERAREKKYMLPAFPIGTHTRSSYHS